MISWGPFGQLWGGITDSSSSPPGSKPRQLPLGAKASRPVISRPRISVWIS